MIMIEIKRERQVDIENAMLDVHVSIALPCKEASHRAPACCLLFGNPN
jgi:hypothetical protein